MAPKHILRTLAGPALLVVVGTILWSNRGHLIPRSTDSTETASSTPETKADLQILELSLQARKNLGLVSKAAKPTDYWRKVTIPAVVQDRSGVSDRGVTSPAVGVVSEIHVYPGDTVRPGEHLVTVQLFSEYLQATQTQLFKAAQEIALVEAEIRRISDLARNGAVSGSRLIELNNNVTRQRTLVKAARQELLTRGLSPQQIDDAESGSFVSTIEVNAPPPRSIRAPEDARSPDGVSQAAMVVRNDSESSIIYEVQELAVELGQTVQAGQVIASLANHQSLYVVGRAFQREAGFLEQAAQESRSIDIEFADDDLQHWPELEQTFQIRNLSNSMDPESRTFDFFVPLANQSRSYERTGETFLVWRFRPGQRARIHVPVDKLPNVFVLPEEAVVHEGPEAFVYRQNGDLFNQISVHVLHQDRLNVVIANDGSITPGTFLAQNAAASLRRVLKAQSASGEQPGLHVHADGTVHAAH